MNWSLYLLYYSLSWEIAHINIATPAFLCLLVAWCIFFSTSYFILYFKFVSFRQHIAGFQSFILFDNLCLICLPCVLYFLISLFFLCSFCPSFFWVCQVSLKIFLVLIFFSNDFWAVLLCIILNGCPRD